MKNAFGKDFNPKNKGGNTKTNDLNHDLVVYLNELFGEIPNERDKEIIIRNIATYYNSLDTVMYKHHSDN